jgi:hypothetical protein
LKDRSRTKENEGEDYHTVLNIIGSDLCVLSSLPCPSFSLVLSSSSDTAIQEGFDTINMAKTTATLGLLSVV